MFGRDGTDLNFYRNSICYQIGFWGSSGGESVSGSFGSSFSALFGAVSNRGIGIPETTTTDWLRNSHQVIDKIFYRKYELIPGEPLTLAASYGGGNARCGLIAATFTPQADKDYEARLDVDWKRGYCVLNVSEIVPSTAPATLKPVLLSTADKCH